MKILEKEMGLREETRGLQQVRDTIDSGKFGKRAESMGKTQSDILEMTEKAVVAIEELEEADGLSFPSEKKLLRGVSKIMMEVEELLFAHETGPKAIAAETEVIELLLQAQRKPPPKQQSKGSAGSKPGGGGEGDTEESALALIGRGNESNAERVERAIEQTSGVQAVGYPTEYRRGLDQYFSDLEDDSQ